MATRPILHPPVTGIRGYDFARLGPRFLPELEALYDPQPAGETTIIFGMWQLFVCCTALLKSHYRCRRLIFPPIILSSIPGRVDYYPPSARPAGAQLTANEIPAGGPKSRRWISATGASLVERPSRARAVYGWHFTAGISDACGA